MKFCKTYADAFKLSAEGGGSVWHDGHEEYVVATDEELEEYTSWEEHQQVWVQLHDRRRSPRVPFRARVKVERVTVH